MGTTDVVAILLGLLTPMAANAAAAENPGPPTIELFYNELAPYGEWVETADYGWVWVPDVAGAGWRPYAEGYWVYTDDYGWAWISDNSWGWAPFHYGRWTRSVEYGWIWVPGTEWGPAWVSWRADNDWIGWAPLPPEVIWGERGIVHDRDDVDANISPTAWSFVKMADFQQREIEMFVARSAETASLVQKTKNITNLVWENGRVCTRCLAPEVIAERTGGPVAHFRIIDVKSPGRVQPSGDEIAMFRPVLSKEKPPTDPPSKPVLSREPRSSAPQRPDGARSQPPPRLAPPPAAPSPSRPPRGPQTERPRTEMPRSGQTQPRPRRTAP